jgi:hypothetical protein
MEVFDWAGDTNYYAVNQDSPDDLYFLGAGGVRGPASTIYVMKLGTNGAFGQATWEAVPTMYPPVHRDAAEWAARRELGLDPVTVGNLLANDSFETNTGNGGTANHWSSGAAAATYDWGRRSGAWGMGIASWVNDHGYFYQDMSGVQAGTGYTFSIWLARDAAFSPGTVEMKLEWYDDAMGPIGAVTQEVSSGITEAFQYFSVSAAAPSGTETVRCTLWCGGITGSGALKCDDASLTSSADGAPLVEARLVYDPGVDASPFLPRWHVVFNVEGSLETNDVDQDYDLSGDDDGDGQSNGLELYAGTNPGDPTSMMETDMDWLEFANPGEHIVIRWPSKAGRQYSVMQSTNIVDYFSPIASHVGATPPVNEYTAPLPAAAAFYFIEVE